MSRRRDRARSWWWAIAAPALLAGLLVGGCGGGGGLPSSLPSSIPSSFGGSLSGSFSGTRTTTGGPGTSDTQPGTTETETETTTETTTTPTTETETATTTETSTTPGTTETVTAAASTAEPSSGDETPWGWIALGAVLVAALVAAVAWALGRRGAPGREWRAKAFQTAADGTAFHDAALAELLAATTANRPERWSAVATHADRVVASLQQLAASPPDDATRQVTQGALEAAGFARSALAVVSASPAGRPVDPDAEGTLRMRLDDLSVALGRLRTASRQD